MKKTLFVCAVLSVCHLLLVGCSDNRIATSGVSRVDHSQSQPLESSSVSAQNPMPAPNPNLLVIGGVELNFIDLPAVTELEARELDQALVALGRRGRTSIRAMSSFRAAEAKTSIGLYHAVMGVYPDLTQVYRLSEQERAEIRRQWEANSDLPLTYTTVAQDMAFAERLSQITGRRFSIMTNSQNEYSIRGRVLDANGHPTGAITTSTYHFGEGDEEVESRAFILSNPLTLNRVHGVHEIPEGADALYRNSFGLIHPIGNVWSRSVEGVVRGGAFNYEWGAEASWLLQGREDDRSGFIGSRLAEALSP